MPSVSETLRLSCSVPFFLIAHTQGLFSPSPGLMALFHIAHVESQPELILPGHSNELKARLAVLRPLHDAEINAHRTFGIEIHPELHALAWF